MKAKWQKQMDTAFDLYFSLSKALNSDIDALLDQDLSSQASRRNFIRAASAMVEGYTHCFREMCQVGIETGPGPLDAKEAKALTVERSFGNIDRTKLTIRATYKLFGLPERPNFSEHGWAQAQLLLKKRDRLMHPKSMRDFDVHDADWDAIYEGTTWIASALLSFMAQVAKVHGSANASKTSD